MRILISGALGFVAYNVTTSLLIKGYDLILVDNLRASATELLQLRRSKLQKIMTGSSRFIILDVNDDTAMSRLFASTKPDLYICFAAVPSTRIHKSSVTDQFVSNVYTARSLLLARRFACKAILISSSTAAEASLGNIVQLANGRSYALSKLHAELLVAPFTDVYTFRLFNVIGELPRPDLLISLYTSACVNRIPFTLFVDAHTNRYFTPVDYTVASILRLINGDTPRDVLDVKYRRSYSVWSFCSFLSQVLGMTPLEFRYPGSDQILDVHTFMSVANELDAPDSELQCSVIRSLSSIISNNKYYSR